MKKIIQFILTLIIIFNIQLKSQSIPTTINYQGVLKDASGVVVSDGDYNITFKIYNTASGGTTLWTETKTININKGIVNTLLGSITPLTLPFDAAYWLGITIGAGTELTPRVELSSVPYSYMSMSVPNGTLTAEKIAGGQVVKSINSLKDDVNLFAGSNVTITPSGNNLTISSTGGTGLTLPFEGTLNTPSTAALYLVHTATTGSNYGVYSSINSSSGMAIYGIAPAYGIEGVATNTTGIADGVRGITSSTSGAGIFGGANSITGTNYGVYGVSYSTSGRAVFGYNNAATGTTYGVYGIVNSPSGIAVYGSAPTYGIEGRATNTSGIADGVRGISSSTSGSGVYGSATTTTGINYGGYFQSSSSGGRGVQGVTLTTSGTTYGVFGKSSSTNNGAGVRGEGPYVGVWGAGTATSGLTWGIFGQSSSSDGYAGYFSGRVHVSGTLSKAAGSFKIDHPLDPENKYLYHSFVESPDMKNIYDGNVSTDASGFATVELPEWFEALNRDFRYQLTVIGDFAQAIISKEIQNNQFEIRTDKPNVKVSWLVTGIRKDAYAENNRIPVEEFKSAEEKGKYAHPEAFGLPKSLGIDQNHFGNLVQTQEEVRTDIIDRTNDSEPDRIFEPTKTNFELPKTNEFETEKRN